MLSDEEKGERAWAWSEFVAACRALHGERYDSERHNMTMLPEVLCFRVREALDFLFESQVREPLAREARSVTCFGSLDGEWRHVEDRYLRDFDSALADLRETAVAS